MQLLSSKNSVQLSFFLNHRQKHDNENKQLNYELICYNTIFEAKIPNIIYEKLLTIGHCFFL